MKKVEHNEYILLNLLKVSNKLTLTEAKKALNVSESTIRRLFVKMEEDKLAIRIYGGIQLYTDNLEYSFEKVETQNTEEKSWIASFCTDMVQSGDIIYLDSGTTLAQMSMTIAKKIKNGQLERLTVFTNSLVNLTILHDYAPITLLGGEYRDKRKDFCGYIAEENIKRLHFTKCFLGTDGYCMQNGFMAGDFLSARMNQLVLQSSTRSVVLADSSKFIANGMVSYSKNEMVHDLVTDAALSKELRENIQANGCKIHAV